MARVLPTGTHALQNKPKNVQFLSNLDVLGLVLKGMGTGGLGTCSFLIMGLGKQANIVYLIDFGLSKEYRDPNTHAHIPFNTGLGLVGSTTFASINSHLGLELGR